jgi:hypothetical protein
MRHRVPTYSITYTPHILAPYNSLVIILLPFKLREVYLIF